jgi:hypothetical protein
MRSEADRAYLVAEHWLSIESDEPKRLDLRFQFPQISFLSFVILTLSQPIPAGV